LLEPLLPPALPGGRPREVSLKRVVNAILYIVRSGCAWRLLPHEFPSWQTVYGYFAGNRFGSADGETVTDEIALNPSQFRERSAPEVLSVCFKKCQKAAKG